MKTWRVTLSRFEGFGWLGWGQWVPVFLAHRDLGDFFLLFFLLIFSLRTAEHLKRITFLASICKGFSVCGFLPVRVFFFLMVNFPNPVIKMSSPDSRVLLMISMRESRMTMDSFFWRSEVLKIESAKVALVTGMGVHSLGLFQV